MSTVRYTYDWFQRDIKSLINQLKDKKYDLIVGVNRGGCIPAVALSHALKTPCTMVDYSMRDGVNISPKSIMSYFIDIKNDYPQYSKILLVDDLIDGGLSLNTLVAFAKTWVDVEVATLLYNTDVELPVANYFGTAYSRKTEKRYFDFWWECMDVWV